MLSRRPARTSDLHSSRRAGRSDARPGLISPGLRRGSSCRRSRHRLVNLGKRAPDDLFELGLDAVGIFEADVARDRGHDMRMDALVAIAQLDVDAALHLRMRLNDLAHAKSKLGSPRRDIFTAVHIGLQRLQVHDYSLVFGVLRSQPLHQASPGVPRSLILRFTSRLSLT